MKYALAFAVLSVGAMTGVGVLDSPAFAQGNDRGNNGNGQGNGGPGPTHAAPAPLIAGGIPGALILGGAYVFFRRQRRKG